MKMIWQLTNWNSPHTASVIYLSERLNLPQKEVYQKLKDSDILDGYIIKGYNVLHTFGKEYLMEDIISYMEEKGVL